MDFESYQSKLSEAQKNLLDIVESGTLAQVRDFVHQSGNFKKDDDVFNYVLLLTALRREHKSLINFFIREGSPVNLLQKTGDHCTPLHYAVKMRNRDVFKALWRKGASLFALDANSVSALELAMIQSEKDMINYVLKDISHDKMFGRLEPDATDDIALFHAACWANHSDAIQMFLIHDFSLTSRSRFQNDEWKEFTPLHFVINTYSSSSGSDSLDQLLEHEDVDLLAQDKRGRTPLHLAFRKGLKDLLEEKVIRERMKQLTKVNPKDENGLSHFHMFCGKSFGYGNASEHGSLIESYIHNGVDVNSAVSLEDNQYPGFTALHFTIKGYWETFKLVLENGADPTKIDGSGSTPLHKLCEDLDIYGGSALQPMELLVQYGADPVAKNSQNQIPLHVAFYRHKNERLLYSPEKFLLKNHRGINHTDNHGLSYLHIACTGDDLELVESLVDNGAPINSCVLGDSPKYPGYSALHFAVKFNQAEIVEFLLTRGADANLVNKYGDTPLHLACDHYSTELAYPFHEEYNPNVNNIDWVPSRTNHIRIIELLIKHGADVNASSAGTLCKTPLMRNCRTPCELQLDEDSYVENQMFFESILNETFHRQKIIIGILLDHGADIDALDSYGSSVLHTFTKYSERYKFKKDLLELVLNKGANVNVAGGTRKFTPLHDAVDHAMGNTIDKSIIDLLIDRGADINAKAEHSNTPLHLVVKSYDLIRADKDIVLKLLNHPDINIDAQNDRGETPLHLTINRGNYYCIDLLLRCGADINVENIDGRSPIYDFSDRPGELSTRVILGRDYVVPQELVTAVVAHLKRMMRLKLYISDKVKKELETLSHYVSVDDLALMDSKIDEELGRLESQKLDNYTSFYDILFKDSNAMVKHVQNINLQEAVTSVHSRCELSFFTNFIRRQYARGLKRSKILGPAKTSLNSLTSIGWPDSCSEHILSYMNDEDLKNIIECSPATVQQESAVSDSVPCKESSTKKPRRDG